MVNTSSIKAILGPTNTGKTHLALERMMAHRSGIIGFPLRLLARENYERMVHLKGENYVALITGEEKIIPPQAKWFSCTVEAMPTHIAVDFIAVDEIQLCADPDRGHIFTHRLLHCRGAVETIFLGADTIKPILKHLIPHIEIESRPRLSSLTYNGFTKLTKLPSRCAIVAFSATEVYAIAELIKRRHGGCAIVMGRLSPRTRNSQMELYQNKEVDYLVATDAIGMGLNMNVNHVAFASLSKYDGRQLRNLYPTEIAQIAGRAGRGMQDGTFGTTANCSNIPDKTVISVENHQFDYLKQIFWRNHSLDFTNPSKLLTSLSQSSNNKILTAGNNASDLQTLIYLIQDPEIMAMCTTQEKTQLLWENCQIPDFRKLGNDNHARICKKTFLFLLKQGHIPENWMYQQIEQLNSPYGDIDTLMQRLSGIRVCSYIATKNQWVENAPYWQAQAREVEDTLSDALHTALMNRFVNQRATSLIRNLHNHENKHLLTSISTQGDILIEGQSIGSFKGFSVVINDEFPKDEYTLVLKNIRKNIKIILAQKIKQFIQSKDKEFYINTHNGYIFWENTKIAQLKKGENLLTPQIIVIENEFINHQLQQIITQRLQTYIQNQITDLFPQLITLHHNIAQYPAILRGIIHQLYENGGILWRDHSLYLSKSFKQTLQKHDISCGAYAIYTKNIFKEQKVNLRTLLFHIYNNSNHFTPAPAPHITSFMLQEHVTDYNRKIFQYLGWLIINKQLVRLDIAENIHRKLIHKNKQKQTILKKHDISPLPYLEDNIINLLKRLNFYFQKQQSLPKNFIGPPAPLLFSIHPFQTKRKKIIKQNKAKKESIKLTQALSLLQKKYERNKFD